MVQKLKFLHLMVGIMHLWQKLKFTQEAHNFVVVTLGYRVGDMMKYNKKMSKDIK